MIQGTMIQLRPLRMEDAAIALKWRQDVRLVKYYAKFPITSLAELEEEFHHKIKDTTRQDFMVESQTGEILGLVYLNNIHWIDRQAEMHLMLGNPPAQLRSFGMHTAFLLMYYAFECLNLHKVYVKMMEYTRSVEKMAQKAGFQKEAVYQSLYFQEGRHWDFLVYGLLEEEFRAFLQTKVGQSFLKRFVKG